MLVRSMLRHMPQMVRTVRSSSRGIAASVSSATQNRNSSARFFSTPSHHSAIPTTVRVDVRFEEIIRISTSQLPSPREIIHFTCVKPDYKQKPGVPSPFSFCAVLYNLEKDTSKNPILKAVKLHGDEWSLARYITNRIDISCKLSNCNEKTEFLKNFSKKLELSKNIFDLLNLMQDKQVIDALATGGFLLRGHDDSFYEIQQTFRRAVENHSISLRASKG